MLRGWNIELRSDRESLRTDCPRNSTPLHPSTTGRQQIDVPGFDPSIRAIVNGTAVITAPSVENI
jgi:hypothetical protein